MTNEATSCDAGIEFYEDVRDRATAEELAYRPDLQQARTVVYAECALWMLCDRNSLLSHQGRAATVYDLIMRLACDLTVSPQTFAAYSAKLQQVAPNELACCGRRMLGTGEYTLALTMNRSHEILPRLAEAIRVCLMVDMRLEAPEDLLRLQIAVEAMVHARLLEHRADFSYIDYGEVSAQEAELRGRAIALNRLALKTLDELRTGSKKRPWTAVTTKKSKPKARKARAHVVGAS